MLVHGILLECLITLRGDTYLNYGEFDSGSERTLAAWIRHASRTEAGSNNPSGK